MVLFCPVLCGGVELTVITVREGEGEYLAALQLTKSPYGGSLAPPPPPPASSHRGKFHQSVTLTTNSHSHQSVSQRVSQATSFTFHLMMRATVVSSLLTGYYGIIMIFENVDVNDVNINQSFSLSLIIT